MLEILRQNFQNSLLGNVCSSYYGGCSVFFYIIGLYVVSFSWLVLVFSYLKRRSVYYVPCYHYNIEKLKNCRNIISAVGGGYHL